MELINITINLNFALSPRVKVLCNNAVVQDIIVTTNTINFQHTIQTEKWNLSICHYGKNYITHNEEYVEITDIKLNDVSIGAMIWDTEQIPSDITKEEKQKYKWQGNLYLGHNSLCTWHFNLPTEKMLRNFYKTNVSQTMNSQETSREILDYMKKKFGITTQ